MKKILATVMLALSVGGVQAQSNGIALSDRGAVTNILGIRVTLSYGMPISEEGDPGHLPKPDAVTRCYVLRNDRKETEFALPWKLDEFSVVVPKELAPFRKEGLVQKGTRQVLYQPTGVLFDKRLWMILDSRGKLRSIDFRGGLRIDIQAKTITVLLSDATEQAAERNKRQANRPREASMTASEPKAVGEWSALTYDAIHGLDVRGRLVFAKDALENPVVFLELQNISRVMNTTYLFYDANAQNLTCELRDSSGKAVGSAAVVAYEGPVPEVGWLALPYDSTLRFRVSLPGFGQATNLLSAGWRAWLLPPGETRDYYLSGELTLKAPTAETRPRVWQGKLKLPHVKIPADKR